MKKWLVGCCVMVLCVGSMASGWAASDADVAALKDQIAQLQSKVSELEKQLVDRAPVVPVSPVSQGQDPYDPFAQMAAMQRQMDRMMGANVAPGMMPARALSRQAFDLDYDVKETGTSYIVSFDMPGMDKSKINVELKGEALLISGERSDKVEQKDGDKMYVQQRSFGYFSRVIPLPKDVKAESIQAKYDNGVLVVTVDKKSAEKPKALQGKKIDVK